MLRIIPALALIAVSAVPAFAGCEEAAWDGATVAQQLEAAAPRDAGAALPPPDAPAFLLALAPQSEVTFVLPPERAPRKETPHAAVLSFPGGAAGTYRVALSASAWIDLVQDDASLPSAGFVDFTDCPGLRKMVAFEIGDGPFTLQISDAEEDSIAVAVIAAR